MKLLEKHIETQILLYLRARGIFAWKNPTAGYFDPKIKRFRKQASPFAINGTSDIMAIHLGKFMAIEVKSATGKVSPAQKEFLEKVGKAGGIPIVARCLEDVANILELEVDEC